MSRKHKKRTRRPPRIKPRGAPGSTPGSLLASPDALFPKIQVIQYSATDLHEMEVADPQKIPELLSDHVVTWVNVTGLGDVATLEQLGQIFGLHRLAVEDVINVHQRPKVEEYEDRVFVVLKMISLSPRLETEQVSLFLGSNFVLTFQERAGDSFEPVRDRLRRSRGRIRGAGSDYLAYALIDAVVDAYFPIVDRYGERMERMDELLSDGNAPNFMGVLHNTRGDLLVLRRAIRPLRDELSHLIRDAHMLITAETQVYLRDCVDHAFQLIDLLDNYREMCADLRDYYLSIVNNRMNEVMKVLTITGTIFIPLSFIAGLYGMNFNTNLPGNMPELNWPFGYLFALLMMAVVAGGLLYFFWRKGWLSSAESKQGEFEDRMSSAVNLETEQVIPAELSRQ